MASRLGQNPDSTVMAVPSHAMTGPQPILRHLAVGRVRQLGEDLELGRDLEPGEALLAVSLHPIGELGAALTFHAC